MTSVSAAPSQPSTRREAASWSRMREMWASLAIGVIWLVVLADALFGPDIVSSNPGTFTRIPSAIFLAFFAWLATRVIAVHGFVPPKENAD